MPLTDQLEEAEAALKAILATAVADAASPFYRVALREGDPGARLEAEHVWIPEDAETSRRWDATGATSASRSAEETIDVNVRILVSRPGDDYPGIRGRLHALSKELERLVLNNATLGGSVWDAWVSQSKREGGATDQGRIMVMTVTVRATIYLS
jgi:hypothetical protein